VPLGVDHRVFDAGAHPSRSAARPAPSAVLKTERLNLSRRCQDLIEPRD
jgi:hypothetical protein